MRRDTRADNGALERSLTLSGLLERNNITLAHLHQEIVELEQQLGPVLNSRPPQPGDTGAEKAAEPRGFVDVLIHQLAQLEAAIKRLAILRGRLAL